MAFKAFFTVAVLLILFFSGSAKDMEKVDSLNSLLETTLDPEQKVDVLISLSSHYVTTDLNTGILYAERALLLAEDVNNKDLIAKSALNFGTMLFYSGLMELSAKKLYQSIETYRKLNDQGGTATALTNLGSIKLFGEEFEAAEEIFLNAADVFRAIAAESGDTLPPVQLSPIYNNLGIIYQNTGQAEKAIEFYRKGIAVSQKYPHDQTNLGNLYNNLGSTYIDLGLYTDAYQAIMKALGIREDAGNIAGVAQSYRMLGVYYMALENYLQAIEAFKESERIALEVGNIGLIVPVSEKLYEIYKSLNNPAQALHYHEQFKEFSDKVNLEQSLAQIRALEMATEFEERERLRQIEQRRIKARNTFIWVVMLLVVVIMALMFFLSLSRVKGLRLKNKNIRLISENMKLEKENLQNELEMKKKELTTNVMYQIRKNELIGDIARKLLAYSRELKKTDQEQVISIVKELEKTQHESIWEEFEIRFHQVHNEFFDRINASHSDLSINERRLCAFLRLNMTTKEIASITGQSQRSIEVARTRLRKKLNLTNSETGLVEYLATL